MPTVDEMRRAGFEIKGEKAIKVNYANDVRRATKAGGQADIRLDGAGKVAELERTVRNGAVGPVCVQKGIGRQLLVRVTSVRKRLLDDDNLAEKYHVDLLRYSGIISGDSPATTRIEVAQQKAGKGEPEEVRIEVFEL
jgi:hypothetical protein